MRSQKVTVTEEHIALLRRMYVNWDDDAYDGAPAIDIKRPYGNSDVLGDVAEILGWPLTKDRWGEEVMTEEQGERARVLHESMADVLQVLVQNPTDFGPGVWVNTSKHAPYTIGFTREA